MALENLEIPLIENTVMKKRTGENGSVVSYRIYPAEGFLLHTNTLDETVFDDITGLPTGEVVKKYTKAFATVGADYNFETNERGIYAVAESEVKDGE